MVKMGAMDPVRIFIKKEPHTQKKMKSKMFRPIKHVGIVDNTALRVLFSCHINSTSDTFDPAASVSNSGMDFLNVEHNRAFAARWFDCPETEINKPSDVSKWDYSVNYPLLKSSQRSRECMVIRDSVTEAQFNRWCHLGRIATQCMAKPVLVTPDGVFHCPEDPGRVLSGCLITKYGNDICRATLSEKAGATLNNVGGDDAMDRVERNRVKHFEKVFE
nr:RNA-dependent RNA polymerase [Flumine sobemo-like virus 37]